MLAVTKVCNNLGKPSPLAACVMTGQDQFHRMKSHQTGRNCWVEDDVATVHDSCRVLLFAVRRRLASSDVIACVRVLKKKVLSNHRPQNSFRSLPHVLSSCRKTDVRTVGIISQLGGARSMSHLLRQGGGAHSNRKRWHHPSLCFGQPKSLSLLLAYLLRRSL